MSENGILEAEQRVREMNRMTQQYSEQGNRYLQSMRNAQNSQNARQTRFEPAAPYPQEKIGQGNSGSSHGSPMGNQSHQQFQQQNRIPQSNRQQNGQQNGHQNGNQNWQNQRQNWDQNRQQNFRNPQNNNCPPNFQPYCPPVGDPAGERRNVPAQNEIHRNTENQNRSFGFPDLLADNERLMILLLIYLLMKEKADIKLILALGYLLM